MTTCYPDSMKVKRDIQRRIEDHVIKYCETLEENFKQYSLRSFQRNIEEQRFPENTKYYQDRVDEINNGTANLYKFTYTTGKKFHKVYFLQYEEANEYYNRKKSMGKALIPKRKLLDLYKNMPIFKENFF